MTKASNYILTFFYTTVYNYAYITVYNYPYITVYNYAYITDKISQMYNKEFHKYFRKAKIKKKDFIKSTFV